MGKHARNPGRRGLYGRPVADGRLSLVQDQTEQHWLQALRWVMTQPGLIEGLPGGHEPLMAATDGRLHQLLSQDNSGLMTRLRGPRTHKLGIAFEVLLLWGIERGLGYTCLGRDIQIQDGKRTMGALDFVVRAPDGAIEHWELAYKLFLQCDGGTDWSSWLGPRGRDRLDAKLHKMLNHQLPMSDTPQARATLRALGVEQIDRRRAMIQGALFSPWGSPAPRARDGHTLPQGRWLRPSQLSALLESSPRARWVQRHKPLWFGPAPTTERHRTLSSSSMQQVAASTTLDTPQLWSQVLSEDPSTERMYFLVHEDWGS